MIPSNIRESIAILLDFDVSALERRGQDLDFKEVFPFIEEMMAAVKTASNE